MVEAEAAVAAGRHADHPMVLVSDPAVLDETRLNAAGLRPFWTYAHVPSNSTLDATEAVTAQVERFAPGFRDLVVASSAIPASKLSEHNSELSRRRHRRRPDHPAAHPPRPGAALGPLRHTGTRRVHRLVVDPARAGRPRHGRLPRCEAGAARRLRHP